MESSTTMEETETMTKHIHPALALGFNLLLDMLGQQPDRAAAAEDEYPELADFPEVQQLKHERGAVITILGAPKMGKTVAARRLAEIIGRPTYGVFPREKPPEWIQEIDFSETDKMPPQNSTLIFDDLSDYMSIAEYNDPRVRAIERLTQAARHDRKLIIIFSNQIAALGDKYALTGELILLKPPSLMYEDIEREGVRKLHKRAMQYWQGQPKPWLNRHIYLLSPYHSCVARVDFPHIERENV